MTKDEKVEYLKRYGKARSRIRVLMNDICELRLNMMPSAIRYDKEKVQTSPSDKMIEYAEELDHLERQIIEKTKELNIILSEIEHLIDSIGDDELAAVLEAKYIYNKSYEKIGKQLGYSRRSVINKHWEAINLLQI